MKVVVQRVSRANVSVEKEIKGRIGQGLLLLVGIHENDDMNTVRWVSNKVLKLRIFEDEERKLNKSVTDVGGGVLIVSQFTLYGNVSKGTRPSFIEAAKPEIAEPLYEKMITYFKNKADLQIESGVFGALMDVELINDGPVTILIEKE